MTSASDQQRLQQRYDAMTPPEDRECGGCNAGNPQGDEADVLTCERVVSDRFGERVQLDTAACRWWHKRTGER